MGKKVEVMTKEQRLFKFSEDQPTKTYQMLKEKCARVVMANVEIERRLKALERPRLLSSEPAIDSTQAELGEQISKKSTNLKSAHTRQKTYFTGQRTPIC